MTNAHSGERQLGEQLKQANEKVAATNASLALMRKRVAQNTELVSTGAGNRFDLEQAQTSMNELTAQLAQARAAEAEAREKLSGRIGGDLASVAEVKAQLATAYAQVKVAEAQVENTRATLANAQWELTQTTCSRPATARW